MARQGRYGIYKPIILKNNVVSAVQYTLTVDTGIYNVSGQDINLSVGRNISVDTGLYNLTGEDVSFNSGKGITVDTGFYGLTGIDVGLVYTPFNPPIEKDVDGVRKSRKKHLDEEDERRKVIDNNNLISVFKIFLEQCQ